MYSIGSRATLDSIRSGINSCGIGAAPGLAIVGQIVGLDIKTADLAASCADNAVDVRTAAVNAANLSPI